MNMVRRRPTQAYMRWPLTPGSNVIELVEKEAKSDPQLKELFFGCGDVQWTGAGSRPGRFCAQGGLRQQY